MILRQPYDIVLYFICHWMQLCTQQAIDFSMIYNGLIYGILGKITFEYTYSYICYGLLCITFNIWFNVFGKRATFHCSTLSFIQSISELKSHFERNFGVCACFFLLIIVYRIQKGWDTTANYALNRIASYVHHSFAHVYMKCIRLRYTALLLMVPLPLLPLPLLLLLLWTTAVSLDVMKVCSVRCRSCVSTSRTIFLLLCLYLRWQYIAPRR